MFSALFPLVATVHKFEVNFVLNCTIDTWRPVECDRDMFLK